MKQHTVLNNMKHRLVIKLSPLYVDEVWWRQGVQRCICGSSVLHSTAVNLSVSAVYSLIQGQEPCQCSCNLLEHIYAGKQTALIFMMRSAGTHSGFPRSASADGVCMAFLSAGPRSYILSFPERCTCSLTHMQGVIFPSLHFHWLILFLLKNLL